MCGRNGTFLSLKLGAISPAWHRRARRQRSDARTLLRLEAARKLLEGHHSAQPEMTKAGGAGVKDTWRCPGCGYVSTRVQPHQLRYCKDAFQCADWGCATGCAAKARALEAAKKKPLEQQQQKQEKAKQATLQGPHGRPGAFCPSLLSHKAICLGSPAHGGLGGSSRRGGQNQAGKRAKAWRLSEKGRGDLTRWRF